MSPASTLYGYESHKHRTARDVQIAASYNRVLDDLGCDVWTTVSFTREPGSAPARYDRKTDTVVINGTEAPDGFSATTPDPAPWLHGYVLHESGHAAHTRWTPDQVDPAVATPASALEDLRMLHHVLDARPFDTQWHRAGMARVWRDNYGQASPLTQYGYLAGLMRLGVLEGDQADLARTVLADVIGPEAAARVDSVVDRVLGLADGDLDGLVALAREWADVQPPPPPGPGEPCDDGDPADEGEQEGEQEQGGSTDGEEDGEERESENPDGSGDDDGAESDGSGDSDETDSGEGDDGGSGDEEGGSESDGDGDGSGEGSGQGSGQGQSDSKDGDQDDDSDSRDDDPGDGDTVGDVLGQLLGEVAGAAQAEATETMDREARDADTAQERADRARQAREAEAAAEKADDAALARVSATGAGSTRFSGTHISGWTHPSAEDRLLGAHMAKALDMARWREPTVVHSPRPLPPGKLRIRAAIAADARRASGDPTMPGNLFRATRRRVAPPNKLTVGLLLDVSSSMNWAAPLAGGFAWAFSHAAHRLDAKFAAISWGSSEQWICKPGTSLSRKPEFPCRDDTTLAPAVKAMTAALDLTKPGTARALFVVTDGMLSDWFAAEKPLARLDREGCRIFHVCLDAKIRRFQTGYDRAANREYCGGQDTSQLPHSTAIFAKTVELLGAEMERVLRDLAASS